MLPQIALNVRGVRGTARLNDFSVWWHIAGVAVIVLLLLFFGRHCNSADFLFRFESAVTPLEASSADLEGGRAGPALVFGSIRVPSPLLSLFPGLADFYRAAPFLLAFVLSLLQAQWTPRRR